MTTATVILAAVIGLAALRIAYTRGRTVGYEAGYVQAVVDCPAMSADERSSGYESGWNARELMCRALHNHTEA
jgi:hypothetical protein